MPIGIVIISCFCLSVQPPVAWVWVWQTNRIDKWPTVWYIHVFRWLVLSCHCGWGLGDFIRWWPPSTMWAGPLIYFWPPPGMSSNLGLCAACWARFMCHHELWPTSVSHPFFSLNTSLGFAGGKHYLKITIPIFRLVLQNFAFPGYLKVRSHCVRVRISFSIRFSFRVRRTVYTESEFLSVFDSILCPQLPRQTSKCDFVWGLARFGWKRTSVSVFHGRGTDRNGTDANLMALNRRLIRKLMQSKHCF